ncbi:MAG: type II secretion system GspH family protein [Dehalococcoidales bacterium]|nr:type II secretion system GspH family protein [Dehalococcoidales bacterium]
MIARILRPIMKRGEGGISLVEVIVALALLGIIGVSFLSSTATTSTTRVIADERASAKMLAEGVLDNIKKQEFASAYNYTIPEQYTAYTVNLTVEGIRNNNIQKLTVLVGHHGDDVLTLEGYKVIR